MYCQSNRMRKNFLDRRVSSLYRANSFLESRNIAHRLHQSHSTFVVLPITFRGRNTIPVAKATTSIAFMWPYLYYY